MPTFSPLAAYQQAITDLITTTEPTLIIHALFWMDRFVIVLLIVQAVKAMGTGGDFQTRFFGVFQTMLFAAFARMLLVFYEAPLPGIGISFSNLITDESAFLVNLLDTASLERLHAHLALIWSMVAEPSFLSVFATIVYVLLFVVINGLKAISIFIVAFGFVGSAVCGLLGPLFIPFLVWKPMSWLFFSWLRAFIQYSFIPVVAIAVIMITEKLIGSYLTTLPPFIGVGDYAVYCYSAIVVMATAIFAIGSVPKLTASLFSGHAHQSDTVGNGMLRILTRR